jgi:hypothetical protein
MQLRQHSSYKFTATLPATVQQGAAPWDADWDVLLLVISPAGPRCSSSSTGGLGRHVPKLCFLARFHIFCSMQRVVRAKTVDLMLDAAAEHALMAASGAAGCCFLRCLLLHVLVQLPQPPLLLLLLLLHNHYLINDRGVPEMFACSL